MTPKQNPDIAGFPIPEGPIPTPRRPKKRRRKPGEKTKAQREKEIADFNYRDRVKRMRGLFGDGFKPKDGYDLRKFNSWAPAKKAKVTKYFRVIAPRITGDFIVKRYRIPENMRAAITASLQEELLPGQTAAAFNIDPGDKIEIKVKKGRAIVKQSGVERTRLVFDRASFLEDPDLEIDRILAQTNANVFRILVGGQQQNKTLTRADVKAEIVRLIRDYSPDVVKFEHGQRSFDQWLNGLVAYPGAKKKTFTAIDKFVQKHMKISAARRERRLDELAAKSRNITVKELRRRRTVRRRKLKGRK